MENGAKKRRLHTRTRVERQMDSLGDLSEGERQQILDQLIDDKMDTEADAKAKARLADPIEYADEALNRMKNWGKMIGLSSGYHDIDNMTLGFAEGELTIVAGETSQGKCFRKGTLVLMADGTVKKIEDVEIGEKVQSEHGANTVVGTHHGKAKCYKIIPRHGEPFYVSQDHIMTCRKWKYADRHKPTEHLEYELVDIKIEDLLNKAKRPNGDYHRYQLYRPTITSYKAKNLLIDPYVFGLWLGDGYKNDSAICTADVEVETAWRDYAERNGYKVTTIPQKGNCVGLRLVDSNGRSNRFRNYLRDLGVFDNKHIPLVYLTGGWSQRMELLAGLLDTDGCLDPSACGRYEVTQKSEELASQIAQLARGLGFGAVVRAKHGTIDGIDKGNYYRVYIKMSQWAPPCRVARRQIAQTGKRTDPRYTGFRIEQVEDAEYFGIAVDGDHRHLLADNTLVHNTMLCCNIAANMVKEGHKVVFVTLEMTKPELLSRFWKIWGLGTDDEDLAKLNDLAYNLKFQEVERMDWKTIPYLVHQAKEWGAEIVFIDHLHYFAREMHDVANELGIITQEFKQAAIKERLPIVLISHTRKVSKDGRVKHATMDDLRGSSYIAQDSDIVLMVYQKKKDEDNETGGSLAPHIVVQLEKNRNRLDYEIGAFCEHQRDGVKILDIVDPQAADAGWSVNSRRSITSMPAPASAMTTTTPLFGDVPAQPPKSKPKKKIDMAEFEEAYTKDPNHGSSINGAIKW